MRLPVKDYISTSFRLGVVTWLSAGQCDMNRSHISNFLLCPQSDWVVHLGLYHLSGWERWGLEQSPWTRKWKPHIEDSASRLDHLPPQALREKWTVTVVKPLYSGLSLLQQLSCTLIASCPFKTVLLCKASLNQKCASPSFDSKAFWPTSCVGPHTLPCTALVSAWVLFAPWSSNRTRGQILIITLYYTKPSILPYTWLVVNKRIKWMQRLHFNVYVRDEL